MKEMTKMRLFLFDQLQSQQILKTAITHRTKMTLNKILFPMTLDVKPKFQILN